MESKQEQGIETNHRSKGKSREKILAIGPKAKAGNGDLQSLQRQKQGMETYNRSKGKSREWRLTITPIARARNEDGPSLQCNRMSFNIYLTPQVPIDRKPKKCLDLNNKYLKAN